MSASQKRDQQRIREMTEAPLAPDAKTRRLFKWKSGGRIGSLHIIRYFLCAFAKCRIGTSTA